MPTLDNFCLLVFLVTPLQVPLYLALCGAGGQAQGSICAKQDLAQLCSILSFSLLLMLAELSLPSLSLPLVSAHIVSTSFVHCFELCPFLLLPGFNTFPSSSELGRTGKWKDREGNARRDGRTAIAKAFGAGEGISQSQLRREKQWSFGHP